MKISVLIPVYNIEKYLRKCLDSIISQSYDEFEVIICDDGSTDASGTICDEYAEQYPYINVIHKVNEGAYKTRISMLQYATGEYVLYVDPDDWISTETLEKLAEEVSITNCDIIQFGHYTCNDQGECLRKKADLYSDRRIFLKNELEIIYNDVLKSSDLNRVWDKLIKTQVLLSANYKNPQNSKMKGNDIFQLLPVLEKIESFEYLAEPLYIYRLSSSGMGRNFKLTYFDDSRTVGNAVLEYIDKKMHGDEVQKNTYFAKLRKNIAVMAICAVHSGKYSTDEIKKCFDDERNSDLYRKVIESGTSVSGNLLAKCTFWMFRHRMDNTMILMLKVENFLIRPIRALRLRISEKTYK